MKIATQYPWGRIEAKANRSFSYLHAMVLLLWYLMIVRQYAEWAAVSARTLVFGVSESEEIQRSSVIQQKIVTGKEKQRIKKYILNVGAPRTY